MGALLPEIHGPIRVIATGENVFAGQAAIPLTGATHATFAGLSTKVFRSTSKVLFSAADQGAAQLIGGWTSNLAANNGLRAEITANGKLTFRWTSAGSPTGTATVIFMVFNGGTVLT